MFSKLENKTASVYRLGFIALAFVHMLSRVFPDSLWRKKYNALQLAEKKVKWHQIENNASLYIKICSPSEPCQAYQHTTDSTHALSSLVAFSLYYGSKQWMFYLSLCTDPDGGKSHNLLELYHKTLYEGKYEVWYISSTEFLLQFKDPYFSQF